MAKTKKPVKRYCQCGALLPANNPRVILCEACRKRKLEEKYAANKSPYVQDAARRAKPKPKSADDAQKVHQDPDEPGRAAQRG